MHAIWVSLKQNVNCGSKHTDAVRKTEKMSQKRRCSLDSDNPETQPLQQWENPVRNSVFRQNNTTTTSSFHELNTGHPARNVIEIIFQAGSAYPSKNSMKIKKVLKVNNPIDMLERFEQHRETVKKKAYEQCKKHPRSMVDGNEQLCFYSTTMTCCIQKPDGATELCEDSYCRVCRIIQSGFSTEYNMRNGIQLSTSSQELSGNMIHETKGKTVNRAVIICRTIAGRICRVVNMLHGENEDEYDSIGSGALCSRIEYLIVQDPSAVLPCFVVVLN